MRIGVTGGTGFIGQYLLKEYSSQHEFVVITSLEDTSSLYHFKEQIEYVCAPYTYEGFTNAFRTCQGVIHLGAKRSSSENEKSIGNYFENITVSEALFCACADLKIRNVVNISSTAVYDTTVQYPFAESCPAAPLSNYGIVKHAIENIAHLLNRKYDMNIKSLRIAQVLGYGERKGYMLSIFLENCLLKKALNVYGSGKAGREYIYVKDAAHAIMCALEKEDSAGVFNIGTGILTSNLELAETFCDVFDNPSGIEFVDCPEVLEKYVMDVSKADRELGFKSQFSVRKALLDIKKMIIEENA